MLQLKNLNYMYAKCLNYLCLTNYLPVLTNALNKNFMQIQLGKVQRFSFVLRA